MSPKILILVLIVLSIGSAIEIEMISPSFVDMSKFFNASTELMGWVVTSNILGFILGSIFIGAISDAYGRKKTLLCGNFILLVGAFGCVISKSIWFLIFCRFVQGLGAATGIVLVPIIVADVFKHREAEKFYRIMQSVNNSFTAGAPIVGGIVNDYVGWRTNIFIIVVIELIAWISILFFFEETKKDKYKKFHLKTLYKDFKTVLSNKVFLISMLIPNLSAVLYFIFITYGIFVYIERFGGTAVIFSLSILAFVGLYSIFCVLFLKIKTTKKSLYLGASFNLISFVLMFFSKSFYWMTFCICIHGVAATLLVPTIFAYCMGIMPDHKGASSSAIVLARNLSIAFGVWVAGLFFTGSVFSFVTPMVVISIAILFAVFYIVNYSNCVNNEEFEA